MSIAFFVESFSCQSASDAFLAGVPAAPDAFWSIARVPTFLGRTDGRPLPPKQYPDVTALRTADNYEEMYKKLRLKNQRQTLFSLKL